MSISRQLRHTYRVWKYRLRTDPGEIAFLLGVLRSGDSAVDIGAHKGAYTYWMRRAVGPRGKVFAFEPQPLLAAGLATQWRGDPAVVVCPAGVSSRLGRLPLHVPGSSPSPGATLESRGREFEGRHVEVEVETLDHYFQGGRGRPIRLLKCDVEGHELEVFRGAENLLREDRPILLFECEQRHHPQEPIEQVFDFLRALGYEGSCFFRRRRVPLTEFQQERHQQPGSFPYVNNFVFTHKDGESRMAKVA